MTCSHCAPYEELGRKIDDLDFGTVFRIEDGSVVTMNYITAPEVMNDPDADVSIDDPRWTCLTGMTGQYGYHGAVMHTSEYIGAEIAKTLAESDGDTIFAVVTVDGYPGDGTKGDEGEEPETIGWAIAYRKLPEDIPWSDDARWTNFDFEPFRHDADTGQLPEGTDYLFNLADNEVFADQRGRQYVKVGDGPMQGSCVVERNGRYAHWMGDQIFRTNP